MKRRQVILGTRGSALALTQAEMVKRAIEQSCADIEIVLKTIATTGDKRTDIPLSEVAKEAGVFDKGVFLKEIETALEQGEIDLAVHSLKDMPSELAPEFDLSAVLPRASVEDVLISKSPTLPMACRIGTGSVRRACMGRMLWGEQAVFSDIRGNVTTRLNKLARTDELDGIVLAKAGLERLGLYAPSLLVEGTELYMTPLPLDIFVPAAGQGIIGIETRKNDLTMQRVVQTIDDPNTHLCALAEREFLRLLGADCSTPVGVYAAHTENGQMSLTVALHDHNPADLRHCVLTGDAAQPLDLAQKAHQIIAG